MVLCCCQPAIVLSASGGVQQLFVNRLHSFLQECTVQIVTATGLPTDSVAA
jgi:hypothetical protein